jgi:hypothetical protein
VIGADGEYGAYGAYGAGGSGSIQLVNLPAGFLNLCIYRAYLMVAAA